MDEYTKARNESRKRIAAIHAACDTLTAELIMGTADYDCDRPIPTDLELVELIKSHYCEWG